MTRSRPPLFALSCVAVLASCAPRGPKTAVAPPPEPVASEPRERAAPHDSTESEPAAPEWRYDGPILTGTNCTTDDLPSWILDRDHHRMTLSADPSLSIALAEGWSADLEHPQLLVLRAPVAEQGFRPTFELFIGPVCERVDGPSVLGRIAARAWFGTRTPESTAREVSEGKWSASLGGIGRSLILEVELDTPAGPREASLYFTDYGRAQTFAIYAAAACPGPVPPIESEGQCQQRYRALLE